MRVLKTPTTWADIEPHIEHHHWVHILDRNVVVSFDIWKPLADKGLLGRLTEFVTHIRKQCEQVAKTVHLSFDMVVEAFKSKQVFNMLKAAGFVVERLAKALSAFTGLYKKGLLRVFEELHKSGVLQKLNSGAIKLDALLDQYPLLKRLTGVAIAGLLLWMFLSANFVHVASIDMDFTAMFKAAFQGEFSIADLFTSPSGLVAVTALLTALGGISFPNPLWLVAGVPVNILVALAYTGFLHARRSPLVVEAIKHLHSKISFSQA